MYEREEENSGYSDSVKDLVQKAKSNHQGALTTMDTVRKQIHGESTSPEPKRESRLTSIIDQLLSNKTKDMHQTDDDNKRNEKDTESFCEKQSSDPESQDNDSEGTLNREIRSTRSDTNQSDTNCGEKSFDHVIQTTRADQQLRCASTSPTRRSPGNYGSPSTCSTETQNKDYQGSSPGAQLENSTRKTSTEGIFPAGTDYKAPPGGGQQQQLGASAFSCSSSIISLNNDMPTDMLLTARDSTTLPVKPERLSPEFESSSPSVSPHSPNSSRAFPSTLGLGFGLRGAFPPSSPGLERCTSSGLACGASALKQMEMMTRNYSDFMRCLAAKYNNQNNQESFSFVQPNGIARPFETHLYKSGILGRTSEPSDNNSRKLESHHKLSPVLGENRTVPFSFGDFSSSQTLLNLVRTASAQSASQLENYLRGANKRPLESENKSDPLDLTMGTTKRPRLDTTDTLLHRSRLYSPISQNISDIIGCIKTETESLTSNHNDPVSKVSVRKTPSWSNLLDERISKSENSPVRTSPKSSDKVRCPSFCTDKSCSNKSNASEVALWTIDDVVRFVTSVESCAEYADNFREHSIDGTSLPLLNEDHLTTYLGMKLGPALKLRSKLAKKIGHCVVCMHCIHCHLDEYEKRNDITTSGK
ncbi:uncharacterized protein LOC106464375 isoform X1 [Limulus polyphemus]|uniref:Uncharacterized protein LOC106464375 isoform X1 n=1 Tax=Limulus polyphemus TaxID=6850 RepID=A0ABM1BDU2_LIMPO|nr:uncharacterized protein LOC106464375 isoform X1 [Limulus polyphemus]